MTQTNEGTPAVEDQLARLEKELIHAYLAGAGYDYDTLMSRDDDTSRELIAMATRYASEKLTEVELRSHYVRALHGEG